MNNQWFSKVAVWLVIAMVLFTVFKQFDTRVGANAGHMAYSEFLDEVRNNRIRSAIIQEGPGGSTEIVAITNDDRKVRTTATIRTKSRRGKALPGGNANWLPNGRWRILTACS